MHYQVKHHKDKNKKKPKKVSEEILPYCPHCREYRKLKDARTLLSLEKIYNKECEHLYPKGLEEGWSIKAAAKHRLFWACDSCLKSGCAISAQPWLQVPSIANPYFCYSDKALKCSDCEKDFLFSAIEQQYWYETLQFGSYSSPKQCVQCRRKRRIFKKHFHDLQRALETYNSSNAVDLAQVAECFHTVGNFSKAIEFLRRAKNKTSDDNDKERFRQRIAALQNEMKQEKLLANNS